MDKIGKTALSTKLKLTRALPFKGRMSPVEPIHQVLNPTALIKSPTQFQTRGVYFEECLGNLLYSCCLLCFSVKCAHQNFNGVCCI